MARPGEKLTRYGAKGFRLLRSWETLQIIARSSTPLTASEVHGELSSRHPFDTEELSLRTTREDLKLLRLCGFPVIAVDDKGNELELDAEEDQRGRLKNVRWRLRSASEIHALFPDGIPRPSSADVHALSLLRALLTEGTPTGFWLVRATDNLLHEVWSLVNARLRRGDPLGTELATRLRTLGRQYVGGEPAEETLRLMCQAIERRRVLVGEYNNRDGEVHPVDIAPQAVWFSEGRSYAIAAGASDGRLRAWRLDRFLSLREDGMRRSPEVSEQEVEEMLRTCFRGSTTSPETVRLRVTPAIAYVFREYRYHETQHLEDQPDGGLIVTLEAATGYSLEEWVMGFGENAEVLEPQSLRERIAERLSAAAARYAADGRSQGTG